MSSTLVEDINGSDYVCMTGGAQSQNHNQQQNQVKMIAHASSYSPKHQAAYASNMKNIPSNSSLIGSGDNKNQPVNNKTTSIQSEQITTKPNNQAQTNLLATQRTNTNSISPTPSQISGGSGSGRSKGLSKNLLPYNVTPPRPAGPTEAERKIEELTRQLEEEMEKNEEQGEYFGRTF